MLGRKKGASKNKPLENNQRTLLDLFPVKRLGKASSGRRESPESESQESEKVDSDVHIVDNYNDVEHGARIFDGIEPLDLPPSSPIILSEASSTTNLVDDGESENPLTSTMVDDDEIRFLSPGGSQEDPIVIGSSPTRTREGRGSPQKLWTIFAPRLKQSEPAIPTKRLPKAGLPLPFPDADSQHVRGAQTTFRTGSAFSRRCSQNIGGGGLTNIRGGIHAFIRDDSCCEYRLEFKVRSCSSEDDKAAYLSGIPKEHKECHPAIDNVMTCDRSTSTSQLWTDKWRPRCAAQVLGNEQSGLYLRDWLQALTVNLNEGEETDATKRKGARSVKRRRIVRAVDRKRERKRRRMESGDDEDSWVDNDNDSEEEDNVSDDEDELNLGQPTDNPSSQETREHAPVYTFEQLTNTIILTGPPGSGKTACVYACAEELNWDVFEVYPGIGRRSGANLESMIGEVGKNHLVRTAGLNRASVQSGGDFGSLGSIETGQSGDGSRVRPRQSLVLLEEVDILFKEDTNFWSTVVNFLKDCKRPVICTCNDTTVIPLTELPLQNVLVFEPCPSPVAVSYLQAVCCKEGWSVDPEGLARSYQKAYDDDDDGGGGEDKERQQVAAPDLRRTLHWVQFWCTTSHGNACWTEWRQSTSDQGCKANNTACEDQERWQRVMKGSEALSFLDSEMDMGKTRKGEAAATLSVYKEGGGGGDDDDDDDDDGEDEEGTKGYADRSRMIRHSATRLARGLAQREGREEDEEIRARVDHDGCLGKILGRRMAIRRGDEMHTEVWPYVRQMVLAEDAEERRWMAGMGTGGGRRTRNSRGYRRTLGVVGEAERRQLGIE